jgi:hypothetical protein
MEGNEGVVRGQVGQFVSPPDDESFPVSIVWPAGPRRGGLFRFGFAVLEQFAIQRAAIDP